MANQCPECNSENTTAKYQDYQFKESGLDNLTLVNCEMINCGECKAVTPIFWAPERMVRTLTKVLLAKPSLLSGNEILFLRKRGGIKELEFEELINIDRGPISRLESGKDIIRLSEDRRIRLVILGSF